MAAESLGNDIFKRLSTTFTIRDFGGGAFVVKNPSCDLFMAAKWADMEGLTMHRQCHRE
jgi:hypothetical protein